MSTIFINPYLSGGDWWQAGGAPAPVVVYQPKGAASLAASYTNLVNPGTYNAAPGAAPTWAEATGWAFNGAKWLSTGYAPSVAGHAMIIRFSNQSGIVACVAGRAAPNARLSILPNNSGLVDFRYGAFVVTGSKAPNLTAGVLAVTPDDGYRNGVAEGVTLGSWSSPTAAAIFIGARNNGTGTPELYFIGNVQAVAIYDTSTNHAAWIPAVSAAMAAL